MTEQPATVSSASPGVPSGKSGSVWGRLALFVRAARGNHLARRARRVVLILIFLWIVSIFDLTFTLLAHELGNFREANPIAQPIVRDSGVLIAFKLTTLVCATLIFFVLRRHVFAELGCWLVAVVYTALAFIWQFYYYAHPPAHG